MQFREVDLPGVGKKFSIISSCGDKLVTIIHVSGKREIYHFDSENYDEPTSIISLNDEEAKQLGSVLMGTYFQPVIDNEKELMLKDLVMEWVKVEESSLLLNKSISDSEIRTKTGASIISIMRKNGATLVNPMPNELIEVGDTLVVVGSRAHIENFFGNFYKTCEIR